jgi:hypothetical protein
VVREPDRLGALQMGVAGQDRVDVLARTLGQDAPQLRQAMTRGMRRVPQVQRQIGRDLVVAAATGVQAARNRPDALAQPRLHVHVDVLEARIELERSGLDLAQQLLQAGCDRVRVGGRDHAGATQHAGVGDRAANVVARQLAVELDRRGEALHARVGALAEASPPRLLVAHIERNPRKAPSLAQPRPPARSLHATAARRGTRQGLWRRAPAGDETTEARPTPASARAARRDARGAGSAVARARCCGRSRSR